MPDAETLKYPNAEILVFARAPVTGQVKTRLIPDIGAERANLLYQQLLEHTVSIISSSNLCQPRLFCTPDTTHPFLQSLCSRFGIPLDTQEGDNLGERMFNAALQRLRVVDHVVLIGSDCLQMTVSHLDSVLSYLSKDGKKVVITPAQDGGYVLLGLSQIHRAIFENINWGTAQVMNQTRDALQQLRWQWQEMDILKDLDTFEDIKDILANEHQYQIDTGVRELLGNLLQLTQE